MANASIFGICTSRCLLAKNIVFEQQKNVLGPLNNIENQAKYVLILDSKIDFMHHCSGRAPCSISIAEGRFTQKQSENSGTQFQKSGKYQIY